MNNYLEKIKNMVCEYEDLGIDELESGTLLVGKVLHVAPKAYLHELYAPLTENEVKELEERLKTEIPVVYRKFLLIFNGMNLFSDSLSLDGYRKNYIRTVEKARQPYDLDIPNIHERPRDAEPSYFFIGGYGEDSSLLYINKKTNRVYRCLKTKAKPPLNEWPSLEEMILSEFKRISQLFDKKGVKKDIMAKTTP